LGQLGYERVSVFLKGVPGIREFRSSDIGQSSLLEEGVSISLAHIRWTIKSHYIRGENASELSL